MSRLVVENDNKMDVGVRSEAYDQLSRLFSLEDALKLTVLISRREPRRHRRVAVRWLVEEPTFVAPRNAHGVVVRWRCMRATSTCSTTTSPIPRPCSGASPGPQDPPSSQRERVEADLVESAV
jgi:hypothetical protein